MSTPASNRLRPSESRPATNRVLVALATVAAIVVGLVSLFAVPDASATTLLQAQNGVGVIGVGAGQRVGVHEPILAGENRIRAPGYDQTAVGSGVAPETEAFPAIKGSPH